nr:hypothetical protein [Sphingobacterium sp. E70]
MTSMFQTKVSTVTLDGMVLESLLLSNSSGASTDEADAIFIQGQSLKDYRSDIYANVGNLIEAPCYYTKLTVFENLKYLDIIHKKGDKRIDAVLEMVDLGRRKRKSEYLVDGDEAAARNCHGYIS